MKIGVFDSGSGGKTVLEAIRKRLPNEEYIYFGDFENCPYGERSLSELQEIVSRATEKLLQEGAEIIVVACNTATTQTIGFLREKYKNVPFVGTEPAVKKACDESSETAEMVLLATEGTAKSERTKKLIETNKKPKQKVEILPCHGLAKAIEKWVSEEDLSELSPALEILKKQGSEMAETVILGCTHYPLIQEKIQAIFPNAKLIDGGGGVAKEVERIVKELKTKNSPKS